MKKGKDGWIISEEEMQEIEAHEFKWWEYLTPKDWDYGSDYVPKKEDYTKYGVLRPPRFHVLVEYLNNGCPLKDLLPLDDHVIQLIIGDGSQ